jgi:hypothetical protein
MRGMALVTVGGCRGGLLKEGFGLLFPLGFEESQVLMEGVVVGGGWRSRGQGQESHFGILVPVMESTCSRYNYNSSKSY